MSLLNFGYSGGKIVILIYLINKIFCFQNNEKSLQRWLDHELEVMVNVHEVRHEYEKQSQVYASFYFYIIIKIRLKLQCLNEKLWLYPRRAALAEELAVLRQVEEFAAKGVSPPKGKNAFSRYNFILPFYHLEKRLNLLSLFYDYYLYSLV